MTFVRALLSTLLILGASAGLGAQQPFQYLGPNECLNCHDHAAEKEWYEKKEIPEVQRIFPDKSANAGHINSLNQLETPKSDEFAKAIGHKDKYRSEWPVRHLPCDGLPRRCQRRRLLRELSRSRQRIPQTPPDEGLLRPVRGAVRHDPADRQHAGLDAAVHQLPCHERRSADQGGPSGRRRLRSRQALPAGEPSLQEEVLGHRCRGDWKERTGRDHSPPPRFDGGCGGAVGSARDTSCYRDVCTGGSNSRRARGAGSASSRCATGDTCSANGRTADPGRFTSARAKTRGSARQRRPAARIAHFDRASSSVRSAANFHSAATASRGPSGCAAGDARAPGHLAHDVVDRWCSVDRGSRWLLLVAGDEVAQVDSADLLNDRSTERPSSSLPW